MQAGRKRIDNFDEIITGNHPSSGWERLWKEEWAMICKQLKKHKGLNQIKIVREKAVNRL